MIPLATAHNVTQDKLTNLVPSFRARVEAWLNECRAAGLQPYIYEGLRSSKRQTELYAIGRTTQKKRQPVTYAKARQSMHQYGLAIDFVHLRPAKAAGLWEADWSAKAAAPYHKLAAKHGLRKLGWETPHLEDATIKDWRAAARLYPSA